QQPVYIFIEVVCIQGEAVIPEINVETDIILDLSLPAQGVVGKRSNGRARVKYTAEVIAVAVCGGIVAGSTRDDLHELGIDVFVADGSGAASYFQIVEKCRVIKILIGNHPAQGTGVEIPELIFGTEGIRAVATYRQRG